MGGGATERTIMFTLAVLQLAEKNKRQRASEGLRRIREAMAGGLHVAGFVWAQVARGKRETGPRDGAATRGKGGTPRRRALNWKR